MRLKFINSNIGEFREIENTEIIQRVDNRGQNDDDYK